MSDATDLTIGGLKICGESHRFEAVGAGHEPRVDCPGAAIIDVRYTADRVIPFDPLLRDAASQMRLGQEA